MIAAYGYAAKMGARVANVSFGGYRASLAERDALAAAANVLFVAAAGNDGNNNDGANQSYPCSYPLENVICVGAVNPDGSLAGFSNYGTNNVDLVAPGRSILSQRLTDTTILEEKFDDAGTTSRWLQGALFGTSDWSLDGIVLHEPEQQPDRFSRSATTQTTRTRTPLWLSPSASAA